MGFLGKLFSGDIAGAQPNKNDPLDDFWYGTAGQGGNAAKVNVTVKKARKIPVVRDSLAVLAQSIAGLSFGLFEWEAQNKRRRLDGHPIMGLLMNPNEQDTSFDFFVNLVDDIASEGFFLGEKVGQNRAGFPQEIIRHDPNFVTVEKLQDRSRRFRIREPGLPEKILLQDEVWYIPTPPVIDGYMGRSAILHDGEEAIAAMLGMYEYANGFWANDATPPFIFKMAGNMKDKESKGNFLRAWAQKFGRGKRGAPGLLEYGIDVEKLGVTNEQSQFIETRKELALDIARLWRMPPHKVGILDNATYSNIEQQSLEFVVDTLLPWLRLIERSAGKWLIGNDQSYFQFNVSSLLRGDTAARFEAYSKGRQWGWLSVNEIRAMENMNGIGPAGERYIEPLNMVEAGSDRDEERQGNTQQALRVLHATVPRVTSTVDGVERAVEAELLKRGAASPPELKIVGA